MDLHGLLVVDKPRGITSHDVVGTVRRLLKTKKVGHAGTLDPAAEGVLVLGVGRGTKLLAYLTESTKSYAAHIVLGAGSASGDIEGPVMLGHLPPATPPTGDQIRLALHDFSGEIDQVPPATSAIKVGGEPLYRKVRRGESVDVPVRRVRINAINLLHYDYPDLFVQVDCSAGTYIRALARDIGDAIHTSGYLHYLLRVRSGSFRLENAWPLAMLEKQLRPQSFVHFALHPAFSLPESTALMLDSDGTSAWYDGRLVPVGETDNWPPLAQAFSAGGDWLGTGEWDQFRNSVQPRLVLRD